MGLDRSDQRRELTKRRLLLLPFTSEIEFGIWLTRRTSSENLNLRVPEQHLYFTWRDVIDVPKNELGRVRGFISEGTRLVVIYPGNNVKSSQSETVRETADARKKINDPNILF